MTMTRFSRSEVDLDISKAKKAAQAGPVTITHRGRPSHVLMTNPSSSASPESAATSSTTQEHERLIPTKSRRHVPHYELANALVYNAGAQRSRNTSKPALPEPC